jgi:diguanylate cyclase (GGDEF)-like protein
MVLFRQTARGEDGHYVSTSMAAVLGWDPTAFRAPGTLRRLVHPDDLTRFRSIAPVRPLPAPEAPAVAVGFDAAPAGAPGPVASEPVIRFLAADGTYRHLLVRMTPTGPDEPSQGLLVDVTVSERLRATQRRFAEVADRSPDGQLLLELTDPEDPGSLVVLAANPAARRLFALGPRSAEGTRVDEVFGPATAQLIRSALFDVAHTGEPLTVERLSFAETPGTYLDLRVDRLSDGVLAATVRDVTRSVAVEERLRHQAQHDPVTGLPNRSVLDERLLALTAGSGPGHHVALALVEIDALAELNATLGHHRVDRLLAEVARVLTRGAGGVADLVARVEGNQFAVLGRPLPSAQEALDAVRRAASLLDGPVELDGHAVHLVTHLGVAVAPEHGPDPGSLRRSAEAALHLARAEALPLSVYNPDAERASAQRLGLLAELRRGLAHHDLELRFQPVVELRTGRVTRVEALLRWQREDGSARVPLELLELAERSGLVQPLTRWILGEAARAAARLARPGEPTVVSANLPLRNLADAELMSFLELLLSSGELPAELVEVEISEVELGDDPVRARRVVDRLREMGLRVVIDDFGSSYTPMSTVGDLGVAGVKIDRSFVSTLATVPADLAVVRSTVEVAHSLGLSVTADGVADDTTLALLAEMGCDHAQGRHLSGPVTFEELPGRVAELEEALRPWIGSPASP